MTFIKQTNDFWLNLLINYNKIFNPRPTSYTLFIPFFSLIFTLLSIFNPFSISCIYLISLFSFIFQLFSNIKIFNNIKYSFNMIEIIMKPIINNIEKSISTSSNFNTLKKISLYLFLYILIQLYLILFLQKLFFLKV